jgi:hypothetical protein
MRFLSFSSSYIPKFEENNDKVEISLLFLWANLNKILYIAALFLTPAYRERHD